MVTTIASMKDVLTHCVAQQLCMEQDIFGYMQCVVSYLLDEGLELDDVHELYSYVYYHAQEEALMIQDMYARFGIKLNVVGHGGSQIHPSILLERFF